MLRIRRPLYPSQPATLWTPFVAVLLLIATAALAVAWQTPSRGNAPPPLAAQDKPPTDPYLAWLNHDVAYIIEDREREAFLKLTTQDERNQFIEHFWLRRDPAPGTPENEFKAEHYRRIAYANDRFATNSNRLGWTTDRGRIYIVYGPPDEIESHFDGGRLPFPYEEWRYRYLEGAGSDVFLTFIDKSRTGDYRISPGPRR